MAKTKKTTKRGTSNKKPRPKNNEFAICKDALGLTGPGAMKKMTPAMEEKFKRCKRKVRAQRK